MTVDLEGESPSGKLIAATRVNRKARSASDSLKAAGSETCGTTYRNRIRGGVNQGERAIDRETLAIKGTPRKSGVRAETANESYLGRSRFTSERKTLVASPDQRREKSAAAVVATGLGIVYRPRREGPNREESAPLVDLD